MASTWGSAKVDGSDMPLYLSVPASGGPVVYLMSAASRDLKAGVMFYGGNTMTAMGDGPSPFDRTREISCPIQGHFGVEDQNPSPEDMRKRDAELTRWGKIHEFHSYA